MKTLTLKNLLFAITSVALVACNSDSESAKITRIDALDDSAWETSSWISVVDAPVITGRVRDGYCSADGASWFVTTITNDQKVVSAKWMTTGLGIFDIFVNGQKIGEEILKPGFTHYEKTKRSFTYDITAAFNSKAGAENQLAAQVTPGWWADKIVTPDGHDGMIGKKCAFRGVVELTFADGSKKLIGTDTENWKAGIAGPVKHAGIFDGETYDAREPEGFENTANFSAPEINAEFCGEILPSAGAEIYLRKDIALSPVKAYTWETITGNTDDEYGTVVVKKEFTADEALKVMPGETLVVDFGQNCAAVPSFIFNAKEGQCSLAFLQKF